jgi:hypothetical protein
LCNRQNRARDTPGTVTLNKIENDYEQVRELGIDETIHIKE